MAGKLTTRRWDDDPRAGEGARILITRYRPRGVRREDEIWDEWWKELGPSVALHAAFYGKGGAAAIGFDEYRRRYLDEIARDPGRFYLKALHNRLAGGEDLALLCSSACVDEARCHWSVLRELLGRT